MRQLRDEPDAERDAMVARAEEVAEDLQGTAKNLEDTATEAECNSSIFLARLDELVLVCETCDWWCEAGEICDNGKCSDCCKDICDDEHDD